MKKPAKNALQEELQEEPQVELQEEPDSRGLVNNESPPGFPNLVWSIETQTFTERPQ